jgi:pimeloyl-CoA dehydrogenase
MVHTAEHLRTRKQFGAPLAKFQVMQHRMADMAIALEQLKSMACAAAMAVDAGEPAQRRRLVSAAKVLVSQLGRQLGLSAIQMHGAMGMTDECRVSHFAKRLIVIGQLFGDASWHLKRV